MRAVLLVGLAVVLLIVGILVIRQNDGSDAGGPADGRAKGYIEKAQDAAGALGKNVEDIRRETGAD